jgi:hypothetical protein
LAPFGLPDPFKVAAVVEMPDADTVDIAGSVASVVNDKTNPKEVPYVLRASAQ